MYRPFRVIKSCSVEISVWIYKNDAIELPLRRALSGRFFLAREGFEQICSNHAQGIKSFSFNENVIQKLSVLGAF